MPGWFCPAHRLCTPEIAQPANYISRINLERAFANPEPSAQLDIISVPWLIFSDTAPGNTWLWHVKLRSYTFGLTLVRCSCLVLAVPEDVVQSADFLVVFNPWFLASTMPGKAPWSVSHTFSPQVFDRSGYAMVILVQHPNIRSTDSKAFVTLEEKCSSKTASGNTGCLWASESVLNLDQKNSLKSQQQNCSKFYALCTSGRKSMNLQRTVVHKPLLESPTPGSPKQNDFGDGSVPQLDTHYITQQPCRSRMKYSEIRIC